MRKVVCGCHGGVALSVAMVSVLKLEVRLATVEEEKKRLQKRLEDLQVCVSVCVCVCVCVCVFVCIVSTHRMRVNVV